MDLSGSMISTSTFAGAEAMPLFAVHPTGAWVANTATVFGDLVVGIGVNVWFGAVVRGDVARITLDDRVNLQDGVIVHCDFDEPQILETGVTVGHAAVVHGKRIGRDTLVGIGAKVLGGVEIGEESIVAAGAVVSPGKIFPARSMLMGVPAKLVRTVTDEEVERTRATNARYQRLAKEMLGMTE